MADPAASRPPRLDEWLVETVRLAEERVGPYDDGAIVRALAPGSARARVTKRNLALAERLGLPATARRWWQGLRLGTLLLMVLAILSGILAARTAVSGPGPVNLFWALAGLLGLHLITLVLWLVSLVPGSRLASLPLRLAMRTASWREARGLAHPKGDSGAMLPTLLPRAWLGLLHRARLAPALGGLVSHAWWWLAFSSALLTLLALFATQRYDFTWATTLLAPEVFVRFTQGVGQVPAWLGFPMPDVDLVKRTVAQQPLSAAEQALWSQWLLGCLVTYGWLPRSLAALSCLLWLWVQRGRLRPDWSAPGLAVQCARLGDTAAVAQIVDPAPATTERPKPFSPQAPDSSPPLTQEQAVGLELAEDIPWPPPDLGAQVGNVGNIMDRSQRNAVLARLRELAPASLWIALDGRQTPDRGTLATLQELIARAPAIHLRLYTDHPTAPRLALWHERLTALLPGASIEVRSLPADTVGPDRQYHDETPGARGPQRTTTRTLDEEVGHG